MTHLESELTQLKSATSEMMELAIRQFQKVHRSFASCDIELAEEIIHHENRMNAIELSIDRECENVFALFQPVASDLRFVLSVLKINSDLERIGDHAEGIAKYMLSLNEPFEPELLEAFRIDEMFGIAISMLEDIRHSFEQENTDIARKVFHKDTTLNEINKDAPKMISALVRKDPELIRKSLFIFSTIRKLERVGDLSKNMAEDIIFYIEAKVLKHQHLKAGQPSGDRA